MSPAETPHWAESALCAQVDPELFFPLPGNAGEVAKQVCALCTVRAECLADALTAQYAEGVRGGLSERQRARLKRKKPIPPPRGRRP